MAQVKTRSPIRGTFYTRKKIAVVSDLVKDEINEL